jgi:hypothetical protein
LRLFIRWLYTIHKFTDFPPGSDMMGQILRGPRAADRMEFELFGRLAAHIEMDSSEGAEAVVTDGIYA